MVGLCLCSCCKGERSPYILRAWSLSRLLATTEVLGTERASHAQGQSADTDRAADLVGSDAHRIARVDSERYASERLHSVRMHEGTGLVGDLCKLGNRLDDAGLIVCRHDGDEGAVRTHGTLELLRRNPAIASRAHERDGKSTVLECRHDIELRVMLYGRDDDTGTLPVACTGTLGDTVEGKVVRFRAARCEDDLAGTEAAAKRLCYLAPGPFESHGRLASERMERVGVGTRIRCFCIGSLCRLCLRHHRRRGCIVQIYV